jgi:hypothetical protein
VKTEILHRKKMPSTHPGGCAIKSGADGIFLPEWFHFWLYIPTFTVEIEKLG